MNMTGKQKSTLRLSLLILFATLAIVSFLITVVFRQTAKATFVQGGGGGGGVAESQEEIEAAVNHYYAYKALETCKNQFAFDNDDFSHNAFLDDTTLYEYGSFNGEKTTCTGDNMNKLVLELDDSLSDSYLMDRVKNAAGKNGKCDNAYNDKSCYNLITSGKITTILEDVLSKYSDYGSPNKAEWFWIWYSPFKEHCMGSDFISVEDNGGIDEKPEDVWDFTSGSTLKVGDDKKLKLERVYAKKADYTTGFWNQPYTVWPGDTTFDPLGLKQGVAMTCPEIYNGVAENFSSYVSALNASTDEGNTIPSDISQGGQPSGGTTGSGSSDDEEDPCQAGLLGFGWLFCPGANLLDSFLNGFLNEIDDQLNWTFLVDHSSEIKSRWQQFVNIANIIFAIAFLIMIYSMATSTGLSNYDVKKILPRLIVVAIAVNTSFYICGALVDASNIAGEGLYSVMSGGIGKWAPSMGMDGLLGVTTDAVLIVGCIFIFGIAAIVALAIILVCVTARQIALIVLICISPVAFACYLLPNTTKWFQKWLDYFTKLLLVYPMYTAVWGAAKWIGSMPADAISIGPFAFITQAICMIAPAMAIIPLFKMSGGIMGAVAARAAGSGLANRGHAAQKWMRGKGAGVAKNNFATRGITKRVSNAAGGFAVNHIGDERKGIRGGLNRWAGRKALGVANAAGAHAQSIDSELQALDSSAMSAAQTKIAGYSDEQLMNAITDSSTDQYTARAAMEKLGENMDEGQVREMLTSVAKKTNSMGPGHEREAQALRDAAYKAAVASTSALVSNKSLQSFRNGNWGKSNGKSVEAEYTSGVIDYASKLSADSLSGLSASKQGYIRQTLKDASSNGVSGADDAIKSFRNASETAANDPKLLSKMGASAQKALSDNQDLRTSSDTTAAQNLGLDSARSALETAQSTYSQASQSGDATAIAKAQSLINDAERNIDGIGNKILSDPQAMGNFNNLHKADKQWINDQTLRISRKNNP